MATTKQIEKKEKVEKLETVVRIIVLNETGLNLSSWRPKVIFTAEEKHSIVSIKKGIEEKQG